MNFQINKQEKEVISRLINQGIVSQQQIDSTSENYLNNLTNLKKTLFKKFYYFDYEKSLIIVKDASKNEKSQIQLSLNKNKYNKSDFRKWADSTIVLNEENKKTGDFYLEDEYKPVIAILNNDNSPCLYTENIYNEKYFPKINQYISNLSSKSGLPVYDVFFSPDYFLMSVVNRNSGDIFVIDINNDKVIKTINIKPNANNKSVNVAVSAKNKQLYVSDNSSTTIQIFNLNDSHSTSVNLASGVLGTIVLSHDEKSLYVLVTKPKAILKLVSLQDKSIKKDFPLKGDLFSQADSPYDLLTISDDKKYVYLMTYIPDPEPFTPVITVIETDKEKATQRFSIKDGIKIANLSNASINPLHEKKNILDLLIDTSLVQGQKVQEFQEQIVQEENEAEILKTLDLNTNPQILEIQPGETTLKVKEEEKKAEIEWKIDLKPQKIDFCNITPGLDGILFKKCVDKVMADYETSLKDLSEQENWEGAENEINKRYKEMDKKIKDKNSIINIRLNDATVKARQELEWHNLTVIRLIDLLNDYNFETSFTREECLEWIREKERDELIETGLKTIATNCPNCNAQLLGSYSCRACGFELEKPEDAIRRKLLQVATYHPMDNLKQGHLIITDVINHKVIETDHFRRIIYELKKDVLHSELEVELEIPRDAVRLKNNITLVVDYGANRVFKLTQKGRKYWELAYDAYPNNDLNKPISAAALESGNTVIVDHGNHRVIEVTEDHEIEWNYGKKGKPGIGEGELNSPTFFQRTKAATNMITDSENHRIIELEGNNIIWQYGNENNIEGEEARGKGFNQLDTPLTAWRYENGNTLILDSGNHRVIEVTPEKEISWEYNIENSETDTDPPVKAFRLKTGKIMLTSQKKVVEVDYNTKEITWASSIEQLASTASQNDITTVKENIKKAKVFHGVSNRYSVQANASNREDDEKFKNYMETKKAEMHNKIVSRSPVILTPGAEVSEINVPAIDKIKSVVSLTDRKGNIVWSYGNNGELKKPQFVSYHDNSIIISDTDNKRIVICNSDSETPVQVIDKPELVYIKSAELTKQGTYLLSDSLGFKIVELDKEGNTIMELKNSELFKTPYYVTKLDNGNTLVVDWGYHRVIEINNNNIVWSYGNKSAGSEKNELSYPEFAQRLENGNTLISDTRNSRIIEVAQNGDIVWSYEGQGVHKLMSPTMAIRLKDGHTLITHSNNRQIIEVDNSGKTLWKYLHQDRKI